MARRSGNRRLADYSLSVGSVSERAQYASSVIFFSGIEVVTYIPGHVAVRVPPCPDHADMYGADVALA